MDIVAEIAAANVRHYCDLEVGLVVADYCADIVIIAELPLAEILYLEHFLGSLIAELHNVNAGLYVSLVQVLYEFVGEPEGVHQTAVAHCRVNYPDV